MPHEKFHDPFQWKNKLDDLDHLPGEPLTGKAAWEKLQARLQDKPRKRGALSYWMVAASLLFVASITWFIMDQKGTGIPQDHAQQTKANMVIKKIPVKGKEDTVTVVSHVMIDSKPAATLMHQKKKVHLSLGENPEIKNQTIINEEIVKGPSPGLAGNNNNHADTAENIATIPAKKKLRVVHINELQRPEEDAQWVNTANPDFRSGSLAQTHNYSSISISRNASDNLLKIKLTPSN